MKSKLGIKVSIPNSLGAVESLWWQPDTGKRVLNIQFNNGTQCLVLSGESEKGSKSYWIKKQIEPSFNHISFYLVWFIKECLVINREMCGFWSITYQLWVWKVEPSLKGHCLGIYLFLYLNCKVN